MPAAVLAAALTMPLMAAPSGRHIDIEDGRGLDFVHVVPQTVTYKGHKALKLVGAGGDYNGEQVALLNNLDFKDGTIEVDLAGFPGPGSSDTARGFIGVAFRSAPAARLSSASISARPTGGPTTSSAATIPRSTSPSRITAGRACDPKRRACTSRTSTSRPAPGRT